MARDAVLVSGAVEMGSGTLSAVRTTRLCSCSWCEPKGGAGAGTPSGACTTSETALVAHASEGVPAPAPLLHSHHELLLVLVVRVQRGCRAPAPLLYFHPLILMLSVVPLHFAHFIMSPWSLVVSDECVEVTPEGKGQRLGDDAESDEGGETGTPMEEDNTSPAGAGDEGTPIAIDSPNAAEDQAQGGLAQAPTSALASQDTQYPTAAMAPDAGDSC